MSSASEGKIIFKLDGVWRSAFRVKDELGVRLEENFFHWPITSIPTLGSDLELKIQLGLMYPSSSTRVELAVENHSIRPVCSLNSD